MDAITLLINEDHVSVKEFCFIISVIEVPEPGNANAHVIAAVPSQKVWEKQVSHLHKNTLHQKQSRDQLVPSSSSLEDL